MDAIPSTSPPPVTVVPTGAPTLAPLPRARIRRLGDRLEQGLVPFLCGAVLAIVLYDLYLIGTAV